MDVAIHEPGKAGDLRNVHAHLLCTTRTIERDPAGCPVAGSKTRDWDIRSSGSVLLRSERSEWERCVNQSLEQANRMERVDCRSHAEKQTGLEPQIHLGPTVMAMERKGIQTERGEEHRRIAAHNANVMELERVRVQKEKEAAWAKALRRLESLSLYDLEREAKQHEPGTARSIAFENPAVQAAYEPLRRYEWYNRLPPDEAFAERELYETGKRGWLNEDMLTKRQEAVDKASTALVWANRDEQAWREAHPVKAALFDLGLPNTELKALTQARETAQTNHEVEEKALAAFVQDRKDAKETLEAAIQKALPEAELELPERQARFADIQAILEPKREEAREQARQRELARSQERGGGGRSMGW